MRHLAIKNTQFEIVDERAENLIKSGALFVCGTGLDHDLHLNPKHKFSIEEIESLLLNADAEFSEFHDGDD